MSNKKEGFTLIELLAVIVVLAIVALIAIPIIANVVENAKTGSFKASILNGSQAIDLKVLELKLTDIPANGIDVQDLKLKNNFKSGKYKKDNTGKIIAVNITNGEYCANGDVKNPTITKGNCSDLLVLPEDRMMDSYVDDELVELMIQYSINPEEISYEEIERVYNLFDEQMNQQYLYFFKDDMLSKDGDGYTICPEIEKVTTHNSSMVPVNVIYSKDISHKQDGKVMVWFLDEDNDSILEMHIGQNGGVISPRNSIYLFRGFGNEYDLSNFDTSYVTNMMGMFERCSNLSSLDLSNFDTSNVTDMSFMFNNCSSLISLDLSNFDTSNVTNMTAMFQRCSNLSSLDLSNFDTSNVIEMMGMFNHCSSLITIIVSSKWVTAPTTDQMFTECGTSTLTLK